MIHIPYAAPRTKIAIPQGAVAGLGLFPDPSDSCRCLGFSADGPGGVGNHEHITRI